MTTVVASLESLTREQIARLNEPQLRAESDARWKAAGDIEAKYGSGAITDPLDMAEEKRLMATVDLLEEALAPYEEERARRDRIQQHMLTYSERKNGHRHAAPNADDEYRTPGQQFVQDKNFLGMADAGLFRNNSNRIELTVPIKGRLLAHKALIYSGTGVGGALVQNDVLPGVKVPILLRPLTLLDLIPSSPTTSDTIEYVLETAFTNAAAPVAEATATTGTTGTKPESTLTYGPATAPVRTIAHWLPVTNRMLADVPNIRSYIDQRLLQGLDIALENQIITGDGTGENFVGILNTPGLNTQARGTDSAIDAIFKGMTQVMVTGLSNPTATVLNPIDFQNVRLARENSATGTLGGYLMGPPTQTGPLTLWGRPVTVSLGVPQGTAITGDFAMGCMLWDREEGQVRVGWIDQQFIRNMQTLLAELRAAFAVLRGAAFSKITGL